VAAYIEVHSGEVDVNGQRLVVRNGYHAEREVTTAAGAVAVRAPRVNDKRTDPATGERKRFASAILPAWARKSPRVAEVLRLLYLHGLSSSDFGPASTQFLGTSHGLSAATITRLTKDWQDEATTFNKRSLAGTDYDYPASTGSTCAPPTRSSPLSPPSGFASESSRAPAPAPPMSRWRSSSSNHHRPVAGRQRTPPRRAGPFRRGIQERQAQRPDESEGGDQQVA
jgi:mutator family transposase